MIRREHREGGTVSAAHYSACERYRYSLERCWNPAGRRALFVLLNPSTATEVRNDPTVERCERRARAWGYGAFRLCNLFAWRATDPRAMRIAADPVGDANDAMLEESAVAADLILCGWGRHGAHLGRGRAVEARLRSARLRLWHLGLTRDGQPRHPLYVGYRVEPEPWEAAWQ